MVSDLLLIFFLWNIFQGKFLTQAWSLEDGEDLLSFVTLPQIRAPKLNVTIYNELHAASGYWFVAPYGFLAGSPPTAKWEPCQIGPHIYDGKGVCEDSSMCSTGMDSLINELKHLVWSGACLFRNENTFDFRPISIDSVSYLSFIHGSGYPDRWKGTATLLQTAYGPDPAINISKNLAAIDMHEFNIINEGRSALVITSERVVQNLSDLGFPEMETTITMKGFREIDLATGEVIFDWNSTYIPLNESSLYWDGSSDEEGWDYLHINSVDKDTNGDYLISARYADCIYKVSGQDGRILWRLGGKATNFELDGFNFSKQHDARFYESNPSRTIISFLDNAGDGTSQTSDYSSGLVVMLDTAVARMTATVVARYPCPAKSLSVSRGNMQTLPNKNVLICWSDAGYHSEFTPDGECVLEAGFASERFSTYRGYKFDFVSYPTEPPILKCFVHGVRPDTSTTVCYIAWNGATEVASWIFFTTTGTVGTVPKVDFETVFMTDGHHKSVWAEAVDIYGKTLGQSGIVESVVPSSWESVDIEDGGMSPGKGNSTVPMELHQVDVKPYFQSYLFTATAALSLGIICLLVVVCHRSPIRLVRCVYCR
ncbi:hypothetical protein N7499_003326 [Penicillium canescens]|uniref:ASST-domain-containing protein n=1 Tax=Penicillium canescens TaxID=5083 RepID=A0AAD6I8I3_PENCN|nr:hypothetical protein N7460_007732 [Penicillium canescens]KAJ6090612.1 hypothetical protein N7499_003326 [Penicillium canescens]